MLQTTNANKEHRLFGPKLVSLDTGCHYGFRVNANLTYKAVLKGETPLGRSSFTTNEPYIVYGLADSLRNATHQDMRDIKPCNITNQLGNPRKYRRTISNMTTSKTYYYKH